ncbi:ATP-binding cassette sub-family A member 13 isoform X1 [Perognathus longimembris pacificus]|uniref:ATP-binding cassette sub-family A member 13 isoform X1 n=1 Tax=Perognathus longimembris pacificus TaxID=214514 RepID=UPI002019E141|nr:ATP-binding cassette sub-family A member 13 isoform X1 [Perognathus longimembris pacificus]
MGQAGCQFQTLLWKNWLCRLRHPVLSLAEFFWPCILFMILIVLRFQEPPRHRDTCYLQPRDLPNQGVLSFVQGLLCNTGSSCRNFSFEDSMDHQSRLSRFQTTAHDMKINSLAFLREIQDLAEDIYETMGKAKTLQKFWEQRSETLDSSQGTSFLTMDLNKTEEVISKLEILYQKPHIWNFLLSLPKLHVTHVHVEDGIGAAIHFLQAVSNSLTSLGDLDWLRLHQTFSQVSKIVLNVTISTLTFLKQNGAVVNESVYHLSLKNIVWNPEKVQSDLKSQFGFDDLQMEHILNYSAELREIPTDGFLERMVCSALFSTSEDEAETKGYGGDCQLKWSETKNYLIHAVSWLQVYREVFDQWLQGGLLQKMFTGVRHSLEDLMDLFEEESEPQKVMRALHAALLLLSDSLAADGPEDKHPSPYIFQHLQKFQTVLHNLPWWPGIQRLQQLDDAVRNAMTQDFHFVKEILTSLETSANDSVQGGPDRWQLKKDEFFGELKQLLTKNATATCLNGHPSKEALLISGNFSILGDLWELWCHHSENKTSVLNKLLAAVEDADHILQEVINGHTNTSALLSEGHLGWTELEMQLSEVSLSCSRLFQLPKADASSVDGVCSGGCEHQLVSTVIFHILEQAQTYLEQIPYWKTFLRFIRITCEAIRYVNMQGSFQNNPMVFSEDSPCYKENMDWKLVSDNYFIFFNNLMKSPITSVSRVLNFTKQLLVAEETLHAQEDEQKKFFSLFVEFLEELLLPVPFNSSIVSELLSLTEDVQNENVLWINHVTNVDRNPYTVDTQKLLEFSEQVINKMQTLENHWMRTESKNILRFVELVLFEINPKLLELWLYGIPRGERVKLEALSTLLGFSVPENKKILSTSFNLSWLFHSDLPRPPTLNMDFVHLCETVINGLYEFGFLSQEKVFKALDTVYVLKNATDLFLALSEPQKQEVEKVLTHLYLNVFNNKDSSLLLQVYSSFYQLIYQFLSIQSRESLITYLSKISRHILDIIKQFNFQNISNAFAFLSEAAEFLGRISEVSYCQQIISIFNFLELKTQSLRSSNDKELEVIHNTLIGLKQLLVVDEDFRISLFQYMSQLFNGSEQALLNNECFIILDNLSSVNYSTNEGDFFTLPWERIFSNLSANISMFNEFMAVHCTLSWLQMWTEIWASISQIFKFELHIFPPLHVGLTQLLDELENDVNISKSCQGVFPTHHAARLILNLFKNLTQADYFHDWNSLLYLRNLWVAIDDELVTVKSLNLDQVQKSFFAMKTALHQLTSVPLKTNVSREFLYSLLEVFTKLSNPTKYMGKNVALINDYLLKNLTDYGARFESIITELRETTLFFRNVSHDQDLLSCADLFQKVIVLILEDGLSDVDNFQKAIKILAVLNSTFSSENTISALKGCITWIEVIDHIYVMSNSSFFRGSLHSTLRNLKDIENKMNSILKILTWVFNIKESLCSLNESNINCINIYLKDLADFLNIIISMVLEKEEVPEFEILLALLNDSTNQVKMIIHNLTREFDFLSQANWKHFNELLLRPIDTLDGIPSQFKNIWLHITTLGKEIQKYLQDISPAILERNSFPSMKKLFGIFSTYPKEKDIISLGNSIYHLANYFAFNLSHDLQNSSENIPHELMKSVGLGIQLMRDVFTSLMPAIHSNIPQNMAHIQVLNKITSFLPSFLKKADIELLFDQLEQISEGLVDFFKNLSRLDPDNSGVNLLIGLVEKFMASFHSWNVNHLLRLSQLFPKDEMNAVVDVYYALPRIMGLLQGIAGKTITESLKDVYNFTLLHGISTANIAKEDFATVFKTLLDIIELISDQPAIVSEALTCFPVVWCWNGTTGFQQNSRLETCNIHGFMSSFYQKFTSILEHLHLSPLGEDSQCSNESSRIEMTRKVVCVIHELVDWNSNLLNLSEVFHIQTPLVKSIQEFWYKVLPFVSYFGNQSNGSIHEACPGGPIKQVALKIIEKLKHLNFTKGTSSKNILNKLANLNKIINITTGIKISAHGNNSLNLDRIIKSISGDQSPFLFLLNANLTHSSLEAVSDFIKKTESINNFEELWVDFKQIIKDLIYNFSINHLFSEFNKEIQDINSVDFPNITLQLTQFLEILDLSSSKSLEIIEDFLQVTKNLLFVYADENYSQLIQTLLVAMDNEISTDVITVLTKVITSNWGSLKGISRENNFDIAFITHLNEEQLSNFSVVQLLLVNLLINAFNDVASSSQATAPNLGDSDLQMLNFINLTLSRLQSENGGETVFSLRSIMDFMEELLRTFSLKENSENKISFLLKDFHKDVIAEMSVVDMCQAFQQLETSSEAMEMLQKAKMMVLHVLIIFAENPSLTKDILCATLSCKPRETKHLVLAAIQGVTAVYTHYQEIKKIWPASSQLNCESLIRNLSRTLEPFTSNLDHVTNQDCACQPPLETVEQHVHWLAKRFKESWLSGNPIMSFLSNFTVTEDVKIKDLMRNITRLTEELQSSIHISNETIHTILEANISHSQILTSALTVALSGKCDQEILHLLLTFPEDEKSWLAVKELCGLPGSEVYTLIVAMSQNLNLRTFVYKALIPPEANGLLKSLLDVISSLSSLLARAQHVFQYLPEFLHASKITALIDMPDLPQIAQNGPARSSAFGSFQTMMKLVCKDQTSFLSNSNMFINLPRVNELLEDDKEKFNIPEYSTPFCLKLYQEILQSPNGALVWSFLKPILHGKILYTPDIPEINKIIQKANYTFYFVDKLKSLSEILLKMSHFFQGSGHGQMFNQLQDALRNKFIRHFIESQLHIDVDKLTETLQTYDGMVDKMFNHTGTGHFQFLGSILVNLSSCVVLDRFQAVKSVDVLETKAHELMQQNNFLASVIFNSSLVHRHVRSASLKLPPHVTYTIRTSILYSMRTDLIKNPSWKFHPQSLPADGFKYNYIFVPLQDMIERAIIMVQTGQDALEPTTQTQAAPYPCHTSDLFLNNVGFFFPLIMMLTWMVSVASMVQKLVYEREIQIEEYMRMMGVHPTIHFLAWFLENMAVLTLSSIALAIILKTSGIFMHSDAFIIILFFLDFGVSVIMLSYFLSAFFSQANTAALCTSLVYMLSFLPYIILLVLHNQLSVAIQTLLCLLPTTAFGQGVFFITFLEGQETGIQWNNIYQAPEAGGMTFGWVCWMILIDSIIYFLCGWYLSNLIPGTFGLRKHWYFPFTASYWKNVCVLVEKRQHSLSSNLFFFNENFGNKGSTHQNKAGELKGGLPGVTLVSVNKEYEGHRLAVQDLTLTFHRGQITALLGTNGAGKTTVISMLTGLYPPTSGTIMVDGKNLQTDLPRIRMELGVCPQRDVLLDNLTVREHLLLFASIKAPWWTTKERQQQVNKTLDKVGLTNHQHKPTRALSGGMKRKLSIGIAFIGTSRTVILDEPTSGVDPCSRRSIWDILLKYREGRTIIFTTHHLDEAELLSDCVAILQQGRLRCCGPPLCLKEAYSQGLSLTLTKQCSVLEAHDAKDVARITSLIQVYVPQAFLKDSSGGELTYTIPEAADKTCFKGLFQALDQNLQHLHLTGYGISDTTLEQVFLKLLQDSNKKSHIALGTMLEPQNQRPTGPLFDYCDSPSWNPPEKNLPVCMRGHQLLLVQVTALLRRRLYHTLRAWKSTFSNLLLPVLFVALAMGLFMVQPLATTYPPLKLTPGHYERAESYFFSSGKDNMDLTHVLLRKFKDHDHHCGNLDAALKNSSRWHKDPFSSSAFQDSCGCLLQKCPNGSAPYLTNCLGHKLLNLSGFNVEEYLLQPSEKPRLGGWSFGAGVLNKVQDSRTMAKVWFNQKGFHSLPSYLNHLNNLILWRHLPSTVDWRQYGITLYSHPYGGALLNEDKILESIRQCGVALCIVLGFSVLSAWFGSSVVRDRVTGAKKLQHLSGLGYRTYWFTYFFHDMLFYLVSVSLCVAIIAAFQLTAFTFRENLAATALLLALFGYAMLPWMYLMSRIFSSPDVAFISYISLNFIFGLCTMLMTTMPKLLAIISKAQNLQNIYNVLKWVFTIFPQFCLGQGLLELCYNQIKYDLTHNFGIDSYASPFEMNFLGWIYVVLALQGTFLLLLRILLHWDLLWQPRGHTVLEHTVKFSKDRDVEKEQMRVFEGRTSGDILVLCNLSKSYRSFCKKVTAVEDVTVGIPKGECFGLLGVNGAGKSTMFKMLNGEIPPSSGHAVIRTPLGDDIDLSSAGEAGILIGYCPQQDALDDLLTGWEHLHYYCSLRGIPKQCIKEVAGDLVRRLHLEAHADKLVVTYSGGTKRKLSTALAMVGKPDILLLDEPSSGMDACSKRYLWQTIMKEVREGCAAVLTSHSMEECEALCTRLAIMVDGSFKCLGSPQHIKNRFGDGYVVKIWLSKEADQPSTISDCLKLHFPEIQFKGQCLNLLEYHVPKTWECLADLFKVLENNRTLLNIKHYSINQTTLEQVFIHFAGEQQPTVQSTPDLSSDSQHLSHLPV